MVKPTPPIARVLREVRDRLCAAGHEVINWDPLGMVEGITLLSSIFRADNGLTLKRQLARSGEPPLKEMVLSPEAEELRVTELWELHVKKTNFQNAYLDRLNTANIDALLLPTQPCVTSRHSSKAHSKFTSRIVRTALTMLVAYTAVFNLLDYSAVSFPTGMMVDKSIDQVAEDYVALSPLCGIIQKQCKCINLHGLLS